MEPTISDVNSGDGTACLPMNSRLRIAIQPAGAFIAPPNPPEAPPAAAPPPGAAPSDATPQGRTLTPRSSADADGVHVTACPASCSIYCSFPASNTVAKRHPSFLARTETWDKMSGMSGVMTPTTPMGMSSSPPTLRETRIVGTEYVLV